MRISIIGAGRVGQTLGRLAYEAGHQIVDVVCRREESATRAVEFIGSGRPAGKSKAPLEPVELTLIATPDDDIGDAVDLIRRALRGRRAGVNGSVKLARRSSRPTASAVIHTSGAISSRILFPLHRLNLAIGSCHPLQTFENPAGALSLVAQSFFCVEGEPRAVKIARRLVKDLGGRCFQIDTARKPLYHAAAVMASGGLVSLLGISLDIVSLCGLKPGQAKRIMLPLAEGTLANLRALGPARALTGPVRRADLGTVARNLKALDKVNSDWAELYRQLSLQACSLAVQSAGDRDDKYRELERMLTNAAEKKR